MSEAEGTPAIPQGLPSHISIMIFLVTCIKPTSYPFPKDVDYWHAKAGVSSDSFRINL